MRAVLAFSLVAAACSTRTSAPIYESPSLTPLTVTVTFERASDDAPAYRDAILRITFDDYPDPDAVAFGPILLRSGRASFDADMRVDLVGRAIVVTPRAPLQPDTTYELVVDGAVRALSGRTVDSTVVAEIPVGSELKPATPAPARVVWSRAPCSPSDPEFVENNARCAMFDCAPACHTTMGCRGLRNPSRQFSVEVDPRDGVLGMIDVPSLGLRGTTRPLMRVLPFDSSRSVLLRKLIGGDAHLLGPEEPPYPQMGVEGRRMPLYEAVCGLQAPLPYTDGQMLVIQEWIDQGAIVE